MAVLYRTQGRPRGAGNFTYLSAPGLQKDLEGREREERGRMEGEKEEKMRKGEEGGEGRVRGEGGAEDVVH